MYTLACIGFVINIMTAITEFTGIFTKSKVRDRIVCFIGTTIHISLVYFFINYLFM